jgi:hypothetical protein
MLIPVERDDRGGSQLPVIGIAPIFQDCSRGFTVTVRVRLQAMRIYQGGVVVP